MKLIHTIVLSTSLLGLTGCFAAAAKISQQIKKNETAATFKANAAKPITAAERAAFPAETGPSGAFKSSNSQYPQIAIEPDSAGNAIVWVFKKSAWDSSNKRYADYSGVARANAVDFNYDGYRATITYNPRRDSIRLATSGGSAEYARASYEEFYVYRNGLGY